MNKQMTTSNPLMWIDCKVVGLNQSVDMFTEVAVIITDYELKSLTGGIDVLIKPPTTALEQMDDYVRAMHISSSLLAVLEGGVAMEIVRPTVLDYVTPLAPEPRAAQFTGNSVGTDKTFLTRDMPELVGRLHYRVVNVSSLKELAGHWYPRIFFHVPRKAGGHHALADILKSIDELCYYREVLFLAGEGLSSQECKSMAERILNTPTK